MYLSTTTFKRLDKADALPKMDDSQKKLVKDYRSSLIHSTIHSKLGESGSRISAWTWYYGWLETYCGNCR